MAQLLPEAAGPGGGLIAYTLRVRTSDVRGAGTDAGVSVMLVGEGGSSGWHNLLANGSTFERGQVRAAATANLYPAAAKQLPGTTGWHPPATPSLSGDRQPAIGRFGMFTCKHLTR